MNSNSHRSFEICGIAFHPSSDKLDRIYGVDFCANVGEKMMGVQIKPSTYGGVSVYGYKGSLRNQFKEFEKKYGGKVFVVTKARSGKILNANVCKEIKAEYERLLKEEG